MLHLYVEKLEKTFGAREGGEVSHQVPVDHSSSLLVGTLATASIAPKSLIQGLAAKLSYG